MGQSEIFMGKLAIISYKNNNMPNLQAVCSAVVHLMCKVMIFTAQLNADSAPL